MCVCVRIIVVLAKSRIVELRGIPDRCIPWCLGDKGNYHRILLRITSPFRCNFLVSFVNPIICLSNFKLMELTKEKEDKIHGSTLKL